jgi:hypothetical protein
MPVDIPLRILDTAGAVYLLDYLIHGMLGLWPEMYRFYPVSSP